MDETTSNQEDAVLSLSDGGPLGRVRDPGGLESEGLILRSGSILRGRTPHTSQMSDSHTPLRCAPSVAAVVVICALFYIEFLAAS